MVTDIDLQALAELHGPERAFLTLYLSSSEALDALEPRFERIRALLDDDERQHFEENDKLLRAFLSDYEWQRPSLCVFACWALDHFQAFPLELPVDDLVRVGDAPFLRPLAELQDEHERFVVVVADNEVTRIHTVRGEGLSEEARVRGDIKNDVKVGGQSQKRYERRRDNALKHYAKEVAEALQELRRSFAFEHLVVLGSEETMREICDELPPELRERLIDTEPVDVTAEETVWQKALALYDEEERHEERELWGAIRAEYLGGGRAAMGPEETLAAAAAGRVRTLLVTRDATPESTHCRTCENPSAGSHERCPVCGSEDVFHDDLVNTVVDLVERFGGDCDFADPIADLSDNGDVAALLRY